MIQSAPAPQRPRDLGDNLRSVTEPSSASHSGIPDLMMASVLLCEPHDIYRIGLRTILEGSPDIAVIGESAHTAEAATMAHRWKPQVILVAHDLAPNGALE